MRYLLVLATLLASTQTFAAISEDDLEFCKTLRSEAKAIMNLRHMETDIVELYELFDYDNYWIKIVDRAYEQPSYQTEAIRERTSNKFANQYFSACFKRYNK